MGGRVYGEITTPRITSVSTDSRAFREGALFFAIKGERFDGHVFVETVLEQGAAAAVVDDVSKVDRKYRTSGRLVEVPDTVLALGRLAGWYRRQFAAQVIAVLGSNGKTTVKDLIGAVLGSTLPGRVAEASFNNAIGVPLTLLAAEPADEFLVVEIGTNHPGEVATLARIASPDLAVVTSIGEEHLAFFENLEAVAREEFSFLSLMRSRAFVAVSDQAAPYAPRRTDRSCVMLTYGCDAGADLRAENIKQNQRGQRFRVNGRFDYTIPLFGRHNVRNALAAIAIGTRFRLPHDRIAAALSKCHAPPMRLERRKLGSITVINDAYNANPGSMRAAFEAMDATTEARRRVFILGDMRELGTAAARCHGAVGREAGRSSAQVIVAVGDHARVIADGATVTAGTSKRIYAYPSVAALKNKLPDLLEPGDVVLLKASRAVRLEQLVEPIAKCAHYTIVD
ncbi:MAG: UDP-N-acetylmuramoyl-tripeptide--D-alanyl-D-alanine ligase [Phycisphaerae bacterium]